jgi:hypothetical protein
MIYAEERQKKGEVWILPIILSDCMWQNTMLKKFTALPAKAKPIHSNHWNNEDEAWTNVAKGIEKIIKEFLNIEK